MSGVGTQRRQRLGGASVGSELDGAVGDVEEFSGDIPLPEACEALFFDDSAHGREGALVCWAGTLAVGGEGGRVGEGVDLELEADFDDVQGGYAEAVYSIVGRVSC